MYPIVEIPDDANEAPEQVGTKYKFWYAGQTELFKIGREGTGEHWAEKVACELCGILGLPHAPYDFAAWKGHLGTTTTNFVPRPGRLILGNELLAKFAPGYEGSQRYRARQHTIGRVLAVIEAGILSPLGASASLATRALDIFVGYLLLDAWIGNTDRHHENWGLVLATDGIHLAPTFDHASSLGRELTDAERTARLNTNDKRRTVAAYAEKARSGFYRTESDSRPLTTLAALREVARRSDVGASFWLDRLRGVTEGAIDQIFAEVPVQIMSDPARAFAKAILVNNQRRICSDE